GVRQATGIEPREAILVVACPEMVPDETAVVGVQRHQFLQQGRTLALRHHLQVLLDTRPMAGGGRSLPGGLETIADLVESFLQLGRQGPTSAEGRLAHAVTSWAHRLRMRRSLRLTVTEAQPSRPAISSTV